MKDRLQHIERKNQDSRFKNQGWVGISGGKTMDLESSFLWSARSFQRAEGLFQRSARSFPVAEGLFQRSETLFPVAEGSFLMESRSFQWAEGLFQRAETLFQRAEGLFQRSATSFPWSEEQRPKQEYRFNSFPEKQFNNLSTNEFDNYIFQRKGVDYIRICLN